MALHSMKMSLANPLWGAPRVHGEPLKLSVDVSQPTVAKYMVRHHRRPPLTDVEAARRCLVWATAGRP